jgi:hypothetical protein
MGMKVNLRRSPIIIHLRKVFLGISFSITRHLPSSFRPTLSTILPNIALRGKKKKGDLSGEKYFCLRAKTMIG